MDSSYPISRFANQLLGQDPLSEHDYKEYRMTLETALTTAERREKLTGHVAWIAFAVSFALMFIGGTKVVGGFDPWSKDATVLSVVLGVTYAMAMIVWPIALAVGFSRFRPRVREIKEQMRDASILALHGQIAELRKQIEALSGRPGA